MHSFQRLAQQFARLIRYCEGNVLRGFVGCVSYPSVDCASLVSFWGVPMQEGFERSTLRWSHPFAYAALAGDAALCDEASSFHLACPSFIVHPCKATVSAVLSKGWFSSLQGRSDIVSTPCWEPFVGTATLQLAVQIQVAIVSIKQPPCSS